MQKTCPLFKLTSNRPLQLTLAILSLFISNFRDHPKYAFHSIVKPANQVFLRSAPLL